MHRALVAVALLGATCGDDYTKPTVDVTPAAMAELRFAIVGDTRPMNEDDTAQYPSAIITQIWQDVADAQPQPAFGISTGDYMNASPGGGQQDAQLDQYLAARARYPRDVYAAMGNHECTGSSLSNCGPGAQDGETANYISFMERMAKPFGVDRPWYVVHLQAQDASWTAKIVVVAANAWSDEQATWLDATLAAPTTYTFVVRHEPHVAITIPGVTASQAIIDAHPLTLLLTGHVHTYQRYPDAKEVVIGNGGAPLVSGVDYGYAIAFRRPDGAIDLTEYDYASHAVIDHFAIAADGSPAP